MKDMVGTQLCDDSTRPFPVSYENPKGSLARIIDDGVGILSDEELFRVDAQCLHELECLESIPHSDDRDYVGIETLKGYYNILQRELTRRCLCRKYCGLKICPEAAAGLVKEIAYEDLGGKIVFSWGKYVSVQLTVSGDGVLTDIGTVNSHWVDDFLDPPERGENEGPYSEEFQWLERVLKVCTKC